MSGEQSNSNAGSSLFEAYLLETGLCCTLSTLEAEKLNECKTKEVLLVLADIDNHTDFFLLCMHGQRESGKSIYLGVLE